MPFLVWQATPRTGARFARLRVPGSTAAAALMLVSFERKKNKKRLLQIQG
jgi:hypothetical protein